MKFYFPSKKNYSQHYVAFSGGVDSVVLAHRVAKSLNTMKVKPTLLHFTHNDDPYSEAAKEFALSYAESQQLDIIIGRSTRDRNSKESLEEYWRETRYDFLNKYSHNSVVCVGHNLDDVIETWIYSSMHGCPKIINYARSQNVIRPLLFAPKDDIKAYANKYNLKWYEDPSNTNDQSRMRNYIRANMVEQAKVVNPGIGKMLTKKIMTNLLS